METGVGVSGGQLIGVIVGAATGNIIAGFLLGFLLSYVLAHHIKFGHLHVQARAERAQYVFVTVIGMIACTVLAHIIW